MCQYKSNGEIKKFKQKSRYNTAHNTDKIITSTCTFDDMSPQMCM